MKRILATGTAAGIALTMGLAAVPALAVPRSSASESPALESTASPTPEPSAPASQAATPPDAGLADAVRRDLGMSMVEFDAAGELGRQAVEALDSLRVLPGYAGISVGSGKIQVQGVGSALQARVNELNKSGGATFLLVPPTYPAGAAEAPSPVPQPPIAATTEAAPVRRIAVSVDELFQAYLRDVGTAGLQAVVSEGGKFVIRTGSIAAAQSTQDTGGTPATPPGGLATTAAPGKISPSEFVSRYANVVLDGGAPLKPEADVPGGMGYQTDNSAICSTGFSAFDASGLPAVLTAGHCTDDGTATTAELLLQGAPAGLLGAFQFSQLGGPGNARVLDQNVPTDQNGVALTDPGNVGTDIAVLGALRPDLDPLPGASTYGDPLQPGPDVKIIGTAAPVVGMDVCRSGWRTGWSCGTVAAVGIFLVGGPTYPADPADVRAFNGFLSYDVQSSGGDSGGPWISGNYAVGTHSAGDDPQPDDPAPLNFAVAATLQESLEVLPGYQLELFLNKPGVSATADTTVKAGTSITGRVAAAPASAVAQGSQVRITYAGRQPFDVPVQSDGTWAFTAPEAPGPFTFTAETVNGFSRSGAVTLSVVIAPSFLLAPVITTPDNQPLPELKTVEGTGTPRATVTLSGDVAGSALVGDDGRWSVSLQAPAPYGKVNATAVQSYAGLPDSPATTAAFAVMPPPPAVTSLSDGQHLKQDALPSAIAGTGLNGADVTVSLDGTPVSGTAAGGAAPASRSVPLVLAPLVLVDGGSWRVPFPAGLGAGTHALSVTQAVDGVASAPAHLTFIVDAPPLVLPAGHISDSSLAATGAGGLASAAIAAAAALAVGILLMVLVRRRKRQSAR
ncbi:S1 family peptidase [Pseudarthrobacter sp. L1SW]|uniref:S1 family peptidase n=1 Tax=Pseudarthrobacter sp. L1SW TaxID=2851598 RepID=UPI001E353756|nr:S1 family peptidase [Pseudarthrobacter sp. L1SW]UEL27886.1 S1 family peptidase [Pseudarthrobacter sp. L1SW]